MRNLILIPAFLGALTMAACGGGEGPAPDNQPADLGQEFVLYYGESVDVGPMMLEFVAVTEDSRCAAGVECVWAGNARIQLAATTASHSELVELNTSLGPRSAIFAGHVIELRNLNPRPSIASPSVTQESYKATLIVDGHVTASGG